MLSTQMIIDCYIDFLCPWCYIGKRRLAAAVDHSIAIRWRSFELSPEQSRTPGASAADWILEWRGKQEGTKRIQQIRAGGAAVGLELNLERARPVNTFDAHRLSQLAATLGKSEALLEELFYAYHTAGVDIADHAALKHIAQAAGLDANHVQTVLDGQEFADQVRSDEHLAVQRGVTGVPVIVLADGSQLSALQEPGDLRKQLFAAGARR